MGDCERTGRKHISCNPAAKHAIRKKSITDCMEPASKRCLFVVKVPPRHIPYLDNKQLAETTEIETWWATYEQRIEDDKILLNEEAKFDENEQLSTTSLACHRCHSRLIAIHQQQIRSADEGMTVFCTCKKCGTRWKM